MQTIPEFTIFTKHTIGKNSTLDTDMDLIEMFVRCAKEKDNELAQLSVYNYYMSRVMAYWNNLEDFFRNGVVPQIGLRPGCGGIIDSGLAQRRKYRKNLYKIPVEISNKKLKESEINKIYPLPEGFLTEEELKYGYRIPVELYDTCHYDFYDIPDKNNNFRIIKNNIDYFRGIFLSKLNETQNIFNESKKI